MASIAEQVRKGIREVLPGEELEYAVMLWSGQPISCNEGWLKFEFEQHGTFNRVYTDGEKQPVEPAREKHPAVLVSDYTYIIVYTHHPGSHSGGMGRWRLYKVYVIASTDVETVCKAVRESAIEIGMIQS